MTKTPSLTDIDAESGSRLPFVKRAKLSGEALKVYDNHSSPDGDSLAGLRGPGGIKLHSPNLVEYSQPLGTYLRHHAKYEHPIRECAIMIAAREMDSRFEWAAHEAEALTEGVPQAVIDAVKHRKPTDGLADDYALIIEYGRQALGERRVSPEVFARLNAAYGSRGVTDLAFLIGNYVSLAVFIATIDAQVPDGNEAELPVP